MEFDLLGNLLVETLRFRDSSFDENLVLADETTQSRVKAMEMFYRSGTRYFMRQESVPGDLSIKAIAIDGDGLYLETSPLDSDQIRNGHHRRNAPGLFYQGRRDFLRCSHNKDPDDSFCSFTTRKRTGNAFPHHTSAQTSFPCTAKSNGQDFGCFLHKRMFYGRRGR